MYGAGSWQKKKVLYRMIYEDEIHKVNWGGFDFKVRQIIMAYDATRSQRSGMLVTEVTYRELAKQSGKWKNGLYIKATTPDNGTWDLTLPNVRMHQLDDEVLWFHSDGTDSLHIISKPKGRRR